MSFEVRPFDPQHLKDCADTAAEIWVRPLIEYYADSWEATGLEQSGFWKGQLVGVAGYARVYPNSDMRAVAWAIVMPMPREAFVEVHKAVKRSLDAAPFKRIEAHVDHRLPLGHRWARTLGFQVENECLPFWTPDGASVTAYARIKP